MLGTPLLPQIIEDNPMTEFVELPDGCADLVYCNLLCGVIRGALGMVRTAGHAQCIGSMVEQQVNMKVECTYVKDVLKGDDVSELRIKLLAQSAEINPINDE